MTDTMNRSWIDESSQLYGQILECRKMFGSEQSFFLVNKGKKTLNKYINNNNKHSAHQNWRWTQTSMHLKFCGDDRRRETRPPPQKPPQQQFWWSKSDAAPQYVTKIDTVLPLESPTKHLTTTPTTAHHHAWAACCFVTPELPRDWLLHQPATSLLQVFSGQKEGHVGWTLKKEAKPQC